MKINFNILSKLLIILAGIISLNFNESKAYMYWNQACQFAGNSSSYVSIPNSSTINVTSSFTLEAWVNPFDISGTKGILSKGGVQGGSQNFSLRLFNGRVLVTTNGIERLRSKSSTALQANKWTHVSATYFSITRLFQIYINGVLDTSVTYESASPLTNTDSLFIGAAGQFVSFSGQLDEVRIWKKALSSTEVGRYYRTSLGASTGPYNLMTLSLTFQSNQGQTAIFSLYDWSENSNSGYGRNITEVDLSDRPQNTIFPNESTEFDGFGDYLESIDSVESSSGSSSSITIQCWVYPRQSSAATLVHSTDLSTSDYGLYINTSGELEAKVENFLLTSGTGGKLPLNKWTHVTFYYNYLTYGVGRFYLNGILAGSDTISNIILNYSSHILYMGGGPGLSSFNGFLDEVRIFQSGIANVTLYEFMNLSRDRENTGHQGITHLGFNFDGILKDNIQGIGGGIRLKFVGDARFSHPAGIPNQPVSPLMRKDDQNFSKGFYMKRQDKRIPAAGNSGSVSDSLTINKNVSINDVNLFVALNHTKLSDISIVLIAPNGDSVNVFSNKITIGENDNLVTIFDDNADSVLKNNGYTSFSPSVKSENNMNSVFGSDNAQGYWKIRVYDNGAADTGRLYAWGIQINNMVNREKNLNLSAIIQGFYNESSNSMIEDTLKVYLWLPENFSLRDSCSAILNSSGEGKFSFAFNNFGTGTPFYIQLKHRNAVETWSNISTHKFFFTDNDGSYDFRTDFSKAYGNNMIPVDVTPLRYALYNGDVNQDGTIDVTDGSLIDNDAFNFASGYLPTDLNGDGVIDIADAVIADNNAADFVSAITP